MSRVHPGITVTVLCALTFNCSVTVVAQSATPETGYSERVSQSGSIQELPDSPGTTWAKSQNPVSQTAQTSNPQSDSPAPAKASANEDAVQNDQKLQRPVGTAAAEAPKVSGITAAEPAGAAIAPAKQHRVRTIVIKVGAILGAGAAVDRFEELHALRQRLYSSPHLVQLASSMIRHDHTRQTAFDGSLRIFGG